MTIKIGIIGYGNLGRGVEKALMHAPDMALAAVFSRRPGAFVPDSGVPVVAMDAMDAYADRIDVMILCGGSATDLPVQGPLAARRFHMVDSFDTHAKIPGYFEAVRSAAAEGERLALVSCGWDPGLFSLARVLFDSILPSGTEDTFWGPGVSQGHSDALRRIPGVADARQYTLPVPVALEAARKGEAGSLGTRDRHTRACYVVLEEGADPEAVRQAIVTMPHYFADYDTTVHFLTAEELKERHDALPHGGRVIRHGETSPGTAHALELTLQLDSNPEFTGSVLAAYARAVYRLASEGRTGALTVLDIPFALLSPRSPETLRASFL